MDYIRLFIYDILQMDPSDIYTISFLVSVILFGFFFYNQRKDYKESMTLLSKYGKFFEKNREYDKGQNSADGKPHIKQVAVSGAYLFELINDINDFIDTCKGSAQFSIIQNKTERRLTLRYDEATSKMTFPTHRGLMGTFVGVFFGLIFFLCASVGPDGMTDEAIHSLIMGVLVSMATSFVGLIMSIKLSTAASKARKAVDLDKNDFYEFVQNKIMGEIDTSLSDALASLHETVATFEPQFSHVIAGFQQTFEQCTEAFGDDFRTSVSTLVTAVDRMGENMDAVNQNVDLLKDLVDHMSSGEMVEYMRSFTKATEQLKVATSSLNDFERARRMMLAATQEAINIQKSYNEFLKAPISVAEKVNTILSRITRFEDNINKLGDNIGSINMVSDSQVEAIKNILEAIKKKHKVALDFESTANTKLEAYFNEQINLLSKMYGIYNKHLQDVYGQYDDLMDEHIRDIKARHQHFIDEINEKFNLEVCRQEFAELRKIHVIENTTRKLEEKTMDRAVLSRKLDSIEHKVDDIKIPESKGFFGGSSKNSSKENKSSDAPIKKGTAKPYEPSSSKSAPVEKEKSAKELLHEMGLDKEDNPVSTKTKAPETEQKSNPVNEDHNDTESTRKKPWYKIW